MPAVELVRGNNDNLLLLFLLLLLLLYLLFIVAALQLPRDVLTILVNFFVKQTAKKFQATLQQPTNTIKVKTARTKNKKTVL